MADLPAGIMNILPPELSDQLAAIFNLAQIAGILVIVYIAILIIIKIFSFYRQKKLSKNLDEIVSLLGQINSKLSRTKKKK